MKSSSVLRQCSSKAALIPSSLSALKEIGCKSIWPIHISPLFWPIEILLPSNPQNLRSPNHFLRWDSLNPTGCQLNGCGQQV
jgi:hypothetical protein